MIVPQNQPHLQRVAQGPRTLIPLFILATLFLIGGCNLEDKTLQTAPPSSPDTEDVNSAGDAQNEEASKAGSEDDVDADADADATLSCDASEEVCEGQCLDTSSDPDNCGGCQNECIAPPMGSPICAEGQCDFVCDPGFKRCGDQCVDTDSNPEHCGQCDSSCPIPADGEAICVDGDCDISCFEGFERCEDQCVDTTKNPDFCGDCHTQCPAPQGSVPICVEGHCDFSCAASGLERCGESCVDTDTNADFCGNCNSSCAPDEVCSDGECVLDCPADTTQCGNDCVDLSSNHGTCGSCETSCEAGSEICTGGQCTCASGYTNCNGECVKTASDRNHCGQCNNACGARGGCFNGSCLCDVGQTACTIQPCPVGTICASETICTNTKLDNDHCGQCGNSCGPRKSCCNGTCIDNNRLCHEILDPIEL